MKIKIEKSNGESMWKNSRTRLKFSVWVIIANFILGIVGMILGADLTALGVFLGLANAPLYAYVLGASFSPSKIPDQYFNQSHGGAGGLGTILNNNGNNQNSMPSVQTPIETPVIPIQKPDEFNNQNLPQTNIPLQTVTKPASEIG